MYIIYNCGYYRSTTFLGKITGKRYAFVRSMVTDVDDKDGTEFLKMTSKNIQWCEINNRDIPPFMTLEGWCAGEKGRFASSNMKNTKYDPKKYLEAMLLKK